jgi:hypothetical protein
MTAPNLLGRQSADQTGENQASRSILPAIPGINQHSTLGRLTHTPAKKKNRTINKELKTNTQQRGAVAESALEKGGRARS